MQPNEALARIDHNLARVRAALAAHVQLAAPTSDPDGEIASSITGEIQSVTDFAPSDNLSTPTAGLEAAPSVSTVETQDPGYSIHGMNETEPVETVVPQESVLDQIASVDDLPSIIAEPKPTETAGGGEPLQSTQLPAANDLRTSPAVIEPNQSRSPLGNANVDFSSEPKLFLWARLKRLVMGQ